MTATAIIYEGDNGRWTCGELRCAGATAHFSGMKHDLSGKRFSRVTPKKAAAINAAMGRGLRVKCETCGAEPA